MCNCCFCCVILFSVLYYFCFCFLNVEFCFFSLLFNLFFKFVMFLLSWLRFILFFCCILFVIILNVLVKNCCVRIFFFCVNFCCYWVCIVVNVLVGIIKLLFLKYLVFVLVNKVVIEVFILLNVCGVFKESVILLINWLVSFKLLFVYCWVFGSKLVNCLWYWCIVVCWFVLSEIFLFWI